MLFHFGRVNVKLSLTVVLTVIAWILFVRPKCGPTEGATSRSFASVSRPEPEKIDRWAASQSLHREADRLIELDRRLVANPAVRRFIAQPTFRFTESSFTDSQMATQKIDLVLICDQKLRLLMGLAYDQAMQSPTPIDPEVKLGLNNHPIFAQGDSQSMALVKTHRGIMLLVYEKIHPAQATASSALLILGRILSREVLGGAHVDAMPISFPSDQNRWPDLFGQPVFAIN